MIDPETAWILANPSRSSHIVYSYTDDSQMVSVVGYYAACGLAVNGSVILITTADHRHAIKRYLSGDGNVNIFEKNGQLLFLDAAELLSSLLRNGTPDPGLFRFGVEALIKRAGHDPFTGLKREVRLFGEMVNLVWPTNSAAAERLEELTNEIVDEYGIPVLCTYLLSSPDQGPLPEPLMKAHSHAIV